MKVLLIRREEESLRSAARLKQACFEPVVFPLFKQVAIDNTPHNKTPDFLVFTSAAALENQNDFLAGKCDAIPVFTVGSRTTEAAKAKGYKNIHQGNGTAPELAELIVALYAGRVAHGVYVCGQERAFDLASALSPYGIDMELCVVYRTDKLIPDRSAFENCLKTLGTASVFLYSAASCRHFFDLVQIFQLTAVTQSLSAIAISENTSYEVVAGLVKDIYLAENPNEQSMIAVLERINR